MKLGRTWVAVSAAHLCRRIDMVLEGLEDGDALAEAHARLIRELRDWQRDEPGNIDPREWDNELSSIWDEYVNVDSSEKTLRKLRWAVERGRSISREKSACLDDLMALVDRARRTYLTYEAQQTLDVPFQQMDTLGSLVAAYFGHSTELLGALAGAAEDANFHDLGAVIRDYCPACFPQPLRGAICPVEVDGDASREWVQRCDACERFDSDHAAASALATKLGRTLGYATPAGVDEERPFLHPAEAPGATPPEQRTHETAVEILHMEPDAVLASCMIPLDPDFEPIEDAPWDEVLHFWLGSMERLREEVGEEETAILPRALALIVGPRPWLSLYVEVDPSTWQSEQTPPPGSSTTS